MSFLGHSILILACVITIYSIFSVLLDSRNNKYGFPKVARFGIFAVAGLLTLAEILLLVSFFNHDFSLHYVFSYSSLSTPPMYLISGLWAGNAGSLMFWAWIISISGAILLWRSNKSNHLLMPNALFWILLTELLFLILLFIESPFRASAVTSVDGIGLGLSLQTPLMLFHPPTLLAGYALATVPFALAISAFFNRHMDNTWVLTARRWLIASWLLLGVGNILGMWWAYAELGWGGYWAWDPIENAGLMPWLLLTALLHSSMMYLRYGIYKAWTVLLAVAAFWMIILGAFLARSMSDDLSVHTFGITTMTQIFGIFLFVVLVYVIWLLINRRDCFNGTPMEDALISDRSAFAFFNWIIVISTMSILIGTVLPLITKDNTSQDYFNMVNLPFFVTIILLSGLCVLMGWGKPRLSKFGRQLLWPLLGGIISIILAIVIGWTLWYTLIPLFILGMTVTATLYKWGRDVASRMRGCRENICSAFYRLLMANRSRYGGYIIHIAIAIMALGIIGSSAYSTTKSNQVVNLGDNITLAGYKLTYHGLLFDYSPNTDEMWATVGAELRIEHNGVAAGSINPTQTWIFINDADGEIKASLANNSVAIRSNPLQDLYVILHDFDYDSQAALITVMAKPLAQWIWIGGLLLLLGGVLSFSAPLRRLPNSESLEELSTENTK